MTEQQLISKLQELKQIKPRKDWVALSKMNILGSDAIGKKVSVAPKYQWKFSDILGLFYQRKFAYALASFLFIAVGVFGFIRYAVVDNSNAKVALQSPVTLAAIKSNVEDFKIKSQNLADAAKSNLQELPLAVKAVKDAAKELASAIKKDPR